jgi:hypothetical protein
MSVVAFHTFVVLNMEKGEFYSESPICRQQAKCLGRCWNNTTKEPEFAYQFQRFKDAMRRAQKLINTTGEDWHAVLVSHLR